MVENSSDIQNESWQEINRSECEDVSLFDMCSWGEAN